MSGRPRVAVVGGDRRQRDRWDDLGEVTHFQSPRYGGNGELRRLLASLRAGAYDLVLILARWIGHSATEAVRRTCRKCGIAVEVRR